MKIAVLDFEQVARCYKPYIDGVKALEQKAEDHRESLNGLQQEAEGILKSEENLVLDDATKQSNRERIQRLQQEAMIKDKTFKMEADQEQRQIIGDAYNGITSVVNEYISEGGDVEIVLNRSEVVFFKEEHDLTETIIGTLKAKDLYTDERLSDPNQEG
jgi:Skp family chaperone for outer membrane proteins